MLTALALSVLLQGAQPQDAAATQDAPVRLEDVVVEPRRLEAAAEAFIGAVAAPAPRRGLARWQEGVCVGVANLQSDTAQYIADRVSDVAREIGLRAHQPPCHPSILIVATSDAAPFARAFVEQRPALFRIGATGADAGPAALERFMSSDAPVRWWAVSLKTNDETGERAVRLPGELNGPPMGAFNIMNYAPNTPVSISSRVSSPYRDDMKRVFVIVDVDRLDGVSLTQLADYVAMVSLAQIRPDADTAGFDTILNLFDTPAAVDGLTGWDRAYLAGLYESEWYRLNQTSHVSAIAATIADKYRDAAPDPQP